MDHRDAADAAPRERLERPHERHRRDGVQAARRFVEEEQRRVAAELQRDGQAPPLAALMLLVFPRPAGRPAWKGSPRARRSASSLTFWSHSSESDAWPVLNRTASRSDSSTVRQGVSRSSCGTKDATRRIVPASNGAPFTSTLPLVGVAAPETHRKSRLVVLPEWNSDTSHCWRESLSETRPSVTHPTSSRMRFVWSFAGFHIERDAGELDLHGCGRRGGFDVGHRDTCS